MPPPSTIVLSNGNAQITALSNMISAAVSVVISEYAAGGHSVPLLNSTTVGPFDQPNKAPRALADAVRTIEAACAQLCFTVASPGHVIANKSFEFEEPACLLVVVEAKISDRLLNKPEGVDVKQLAQESGLDADKLARVLRLLATKHCYTEVKPNVFANNRLSMKLYRMTLSLALTDEAFKSSACLNETLSDPKSASSSLPEDASFRRTHGASFFEFYAMPEGQKHGDRFAQAMVGWSSVTGGTMLSKIELWSGLPPQTIICDVGSGNGHATLGLLRAFPKLQIILQDTSSVMDQGKELWAKEFPEALREGKVDFVPIDFFSEAPVKHCDFYYLRHILHNWPDAECLKILANIRQATKPGSHLLIHEFVLHHPVRDRTKPSMFEQAPEPLLSNYGVGSVRRYQLDINMMNLLNSKERTLQEFIDIGKRAGFDFIRLWDSGEADVIEFRVA
ncbi:S-adenosyl-L-methionine-dependent methyltransferase [Infundibulicybe gibba]|nr:S-adenosyl-L-methionine-dependent methyltransferase [Infundibulicybe gibba]